MADPTNSDIYREVKSIISNQAEVADVLKDHEARIRNSENFQIAYEAAAKALSNASGGRKNMDALSKDFVNIIVKILGLMTALVALTYLIVDRLVH